MTRRLPANDDAGQIMKLLGVTGGIGMGKSTAASLLEKAGVAVVDTDLIAREIVEPGQPALTEIRRRFGGEVLDATGRLRRDVLAARVFADDAARRDLEAMLHPRIRERWLARAAAWRSVGRALGAVVIPLLFETGAENEFHATICVACHGQTQRQRLGERGWNTTQIEQRLHAQWPAEKKMTLARFVIWTEGTIEVHAAQWQRVLASVG